MNQQHGMMVRGHANLSACPARLTVMRSVVHRNNFDRWSHAAYLNFVTGNKEMLFSYFLLFPVPVFHVCFYCFDEKHDAVHVFDKHGDASIAMFDNTMSMFSPVCIYVCVY